MVYKFLLGALGSLCGGFGVMLLAVAMQSYVLLLAGVAASGAGVMLLVQGSQADDSTMPGASKSEAPAQTTQ